MPGMSSNKPVEKNAHDWVRDLRFSNQVNMQTMGVDTDRVTPELLLASSNRLLGISRGEQEGDMKDSLQFQRIYGPVEYFAERIQKDGGSVARSMLWKATNKGNLDFIGPGSLQPHVNAVFHESNLSQFVDNSTPFESIDTSQKVTRIGEGGLSDEDSAPIEMRLVQPSYYGFVGPVRTAERCYDEKTEIYTKKGWKSVTQMTLEDEFATLIDGKPSWNKPISLQSYDHDGLMYGFENSYINFLVTPGHRMYTAKDRKAEFSIEDVDNVFGNARYILCAPNEASQVDENQQYFYFPKMKESELGKKPVDKVDIVDFAAFMGWYLSEGSADISHNGKGCLDYRVRITQSPELHPEYYEEIRDLVERLPFNTHPRHADETTYADITIKRKQLYFYLKQFGGSAQKFIPEWIFNAPTEARWAFVDAILKGDGSAQRDLNTISRRLAEDFARLLFELGQSAKIITLKQNYVSVVGEPVGPIYQVSWHKRYNQKLEASGSKKLRGRGWFTQYYRGKVYCPTVPGGLVYVRRNNSKGFWCGNSPGITAYLTKNVMKGTDGKLYQKFINMKTGKLETLDSQTAARKIITTNEYLDSNDEYVYAIGGPKGVRIVKRSDVDYILPNSDDAFSAAANTVPMLSGIKAMRLLMGCHHPETPITVIDTQGYTHIVPAKRLSSMGKLYVFGCDKNGMDALYPIKQVVTRVPQRKAKFKKVILSSGRVLITSQEHKWWVYEDRFKLYQAKDLEKGMQVPRSLFSTMPVRPTEIMGVPITREICVLLGRIVRSLKVTSYSYRIEYVSDPYREINQREDIEKALEQLNIKNYNFFTSKGVSALSIKDPVFQDWVDENIGSTPEARKIPSSILSLPQGYTCVFLDSYYSDLQTIGEDTEGDTWLLSIANPALRDSLSFMLNKIYTDTRYRDVTKKKYIHRALQLFPAEASFGDIVLEKITKVMDVDAPAVMIDIDCDDHVYAAGNGIITHNSKYSTQAVPLQEREAPLVRSLDAQTGMDMPTKVGKLMGTQWAPKAGMVKAVREDRIDMLYDDGTSGSVPLYKNFPSNAKGWLTNYPKVKAGDKVSEGQLLATSNYTDDNGVMALGRNLRIGYLSYHGGTYEDACTISQSAAKKMGYTTMYKTDMDKDKSIRTAKRLYTAWKPGQYSKEQLDNIGDDGVVKVGATINKGDPVILGIRTTEPSPGTLGKRILSDVTQVWEHANPGIVTDVVNGKSGIKVFATVSSPLKEGDKVSQLYGGKGTIAQVIPDDKMPKDSKGRPLEILFDPLGIVSRCYDEQTEFLTQTGWKFGKDIEDSQKLLSWDINTETFQFLPQVEPFYKKAYKGKMYKICNAVAEMQVTPHHKVAYKWPGDETVKEGFIEDIYGKSCYMPKRELMYGSQKASKWQFISCIDWSEVDYEGTVYCPTVSTGYVLTRRNGKELVAHNTNPSQLMEAGLGKVAQKLGKPITVPQFMPKGQSRLKYVKDLMKQNNVPWKEDVYDPETGRTIKNVFTGMIYFLPLKHIADTKMSARGTAAYSQQGVPLGGGQQGCFCGKQGIITAQGILSIQEICENKFPVEALSWDEEQHKWVFNKVTDFFHRKAAPDSLLHIRARNPKGEIISMFPTDNHNMYMYEGTKKEAGELKVGDLLAGFATGGFEPVEVISICRGQTEELSTVPLIEDVYDITVQGTHNYVLSSGVRVSNSKRIGSLESAALVGHNVFNFLHDAKLIRGQQNSDFWRSIRTGQIPTVPGEPLAHKKFFAHLQASGMQIKRDNEGFTIFALSNKDVDELAGTRELKSTDTYQQKSFKPIDGGLFGQDIFGPEGDKWAYIQLDSPLPNPVMEEPLARLLNVSDKEFQAIVRGKGSQKGLRNAKDMKEVLSKLNLQKEADKALVELKASTKSKKDNALKRYVAIARMRDAGVRPQEYMLDRIPVLPPKFRPITSHGDLTMVADSNYLYSQLLNARDDLREAEGLPEEYKEQGLSNLYSKWKELVGLYDPSDVKLKAKNVKGLLKWALGKSPKFSGYMTKVLGSTVDTVGRGVVIPSTKIKLNEIGMPIQMAWNLYAPFVTRKLVQQGYSPVDAMRIIKERKPVAMEALGEAVKERPVVMNRAPSLHKLSLMGLNVKLTGGHAIKVNPSVVVPYGMDFDGDSVNSLVSIDLQLKNMPKIGNWQYNDNQNSHLTNSKSGCRIQEKGEDVLLPEENFYRKDADMFKANTKMELVHTTMELKDLPRVEGTENKKSETVTEWDVAEGTYVSTIDPATGNIVYAPITKVSKHTNLKMFDVNFSISSAYSHSVTASEDHSLITLNPITLELEKSRPEDAIGRLVPMARQNIGNCVRENGQGICTEIKFPSGTYQMSYDMGLFFGLMVGDGWVSRVDSSPIIQIACCEPSLQENIKELSKKANMPFTKEASFGSYEADPQRFSQDNMQRLTFFMEQEDKRFVNELIGHGAENKKIPYLSFMSSRTHMLGVLMGLLATDGVVSHRPPTGSKKSPCKTITYHTISPVLRDGIQELAHRLGVKTSVTPYIGTTSGNQTYMVNFCLEDMVRLYDSNKARFVVPVKYKQEAMERIAEDFHNNVKADCGKTWTSYDIVPFPRGLFCEFSWAGIVKLSRDIVTMARTKGFIKRCVAKRIADALERRDWSIYKDPTYLKQEDRTHHTPEEAKALVDKWIAMVRNEDIGWEVVDSVTPSTCTEGWDCTVPGPYTFTLSTGTVVQDTVNLHVPVSKKAIEDVRQKMMPERNLISLRKGKTLYKPQKAYTQGLYVATRMGQAKDIKAFNSLQEARKEYLKGNIDIDTPIVIKET